MVPVASTLVAVPLQMPGPVHPLLRCVDVDVDVGVGGCCVYVGVCVCVCDACVWVCMHVLGHLCGWVGRCGCVGVGGWVGGCCVYVCVYVYVCVMRVFGFVCICLVTFGCM